ncbi:uncharacterized protein FFUJ_05288 [Fusarium fujikuroi IMI 58289]|uniref:Uncharacterized protein n=1 Tax=Gibberella fujikuroi (strain CBS 195.34 / IMI 58289 / NRRL A-6831) TaxID=1279085 RepID=S0DSN0_GIBF5|nr:uncharacterized protein FFUJ_05288 [Fusarium fujikuroi IMI 58289]CCT63568.1 uncharacterized protein FFUJ_05288 [Fusarium fujikuroi IMI 58289]SCN98097.1 uncharacterized protein FFM5_06708 [Fusarium fujikuroi]
MATTQPIEFPSLDDVRLPSTPEDKELLRELKLAWDQHSAQWDNETKHEFIDRILKGYTKVTNTNQAQPSAHRLWKAGNITFAVWIILRVTYDEEKLSKPREWLRHKYKNFDPQSWASPIPKKTPNPQGTNGGNTFSSKENLRSHANSQEPKSPQSIEAMEICEEERDYDNIHGDSTYTDNDDGDDQDEDKPKPITRSRFRAANVPEPVRDLSRKRGTSNASVNLRTKLQKTDSPKTPLSAGATHLLEPSGPSTALTIDNQARARPLEWKAKLQDLRVYRRGLNQNRLVLNRPAFTCDQASLPPNPTAVSFTQESDDQNGFQRSQEPSFRSIAPALSLENTVNDQRCSGDPRDRILFREHSAQSDHVRANFGLVGHRSGEAAASTQRLPRSPELRGNTRTMAPRGSSDSFMFSSSSYGKEQAHTGEPLPLRLNPRETLKSPKGIYTQQPSSLQQLPCDDPDEPSWFRRFRRQYHSDQKETCGRIADQVTKNVTGIVVQAVHDMIQPLCNSLAQCVDTLAKHNTNAAGDQVNLATRDLRDMKQVLNSVVETSRVQLEASQREGATIQEILLPAMTEHRKDIDNLVQRAISIEERISDVEEYLELQFADKGGDSARNAPQDEYHTFGNQEGAGGD